MTEFNEISLCGIPYQTQVYEEGFVIFANRSGFMGRRSVPTMRFTKSSHPGLLCVRLLVEDRIPACYILKATKIAESIMGPDHEPNWIIEGANHGNYLDEMD